MKTNNITKAAFRKLRTFRIISVTSGGILLIAAIGVIALLWFAITQVPGFLSADGPVQAIVSVGGVLVSFTAHGLFTGAGILAVMLIACIAAYCYCRRKVKQEKVSSAADKN